MVIPGNVYPLIEHPLHSNSFVSRPCKPGYQSHYVIVNSRDIKAAFPIKEIPEAKKVPDESVGSPQMDNLLKNALKFFGKGDDPILEGEEALADELVVFERFDFLYYYFML